MSDSSLPLKNFYESASHLFAEQQLFDELAKLSAVPLEFIDNENADDDVLKELFPEGEDYTRLFDEVNVPPLEDQTVNLTSHNQGINLVKNASLLEKACVNAACDVPPPEKEAANSVNTLDPKDLHSMPTLIEPTTENKVQVNQTSTNVLRDSENSPLSLRNGRHIICSSLETSSDMEYIPSKKVRRIVDKTYAEDEPMKEVLRVEKCQVILRRLPLNHPAVMKLTRTKTDRQQKLSFLETYKIPKLRSSNCSNKMNVSKQNPKKSSNSCVGESNSAAQIPSQPADTVFRFGVEVSKVDKPSKLCSKKHFESVYADSVTHSAVQEKPVVMAMKTGSKKPKTRSVVNQQNASLTQETAAPVNADITRGCWLDTKNSPDLLCREPESALDYENSLRNVELSKMITETIEKVSERFSGKESISKFSLMIMEEKDIVRLMKQAFMECLSSNAFLNIVSNGSNKNGNKKKRVTFVESPKVLFIERSQQEREQGFYFKTRKIVPKMYEQVIERIIKKVLKWSPHWLAKHRQLHLKDDDSLSEIGTSNIIQRKFLKDTAIQELWKMMFDSYKAASNSSPRLFLCGIDSTDRSKGNLWKIKTKRKFDTNEDGSNIANGDVTILSVYVRQKYEAEPWSKKTVFAYVLHSEIIGERDVQSMENITFEVYSMGDVELKIGTRCAEVQRIGNMNRSLRIFQTLCLSKMCPLANVVIGDDQTVNVQQRSSSVVSSQDEQQEAMNICWKVIKANGPSLHLIEGAPGTGKTQTLINFLKELFSSSQDDIPRQKILILMPTETAADNISYRLLSSIENDVTLLRYGESKKIDKTLNKVKLEQLMEDCASQIATEDIELEMNLMLAKKNAVIQEKETLSIEEEEEYDSNTIFRKKDRLLKEMVLDKSDVVVVSRETCLSSNFNQDFMYSPKNRGNYNRFTLCIVDNAEEMTDIDMLTPISIVTNLILVGDATRNLVLKGVPGSPFNRIFNAYRNQGIKDRVVTLRQQYRMHPKILNCLNSTYDNLLNFSKESKLSKFPLKPLVVVDFESSDIIDQDKLMEKCGVFAKNVVQNIRKLKKLDDIQIGIIVERTKQRQLIEDGLSTNNGVLIGKLGDFHGIETDVTILCVPLLHYPEMYLYTGMSRAKHSLIICGNFSRIRGVTSIDSLLTYAKRRKSYQPWNKDEKDFPFDILRYKF